MAFLKIARSIVCVSASVLMVGAIWGAAITTTDNNWQSVDGDWSGSWDDPNHWSLGAIGERQRGRFDLKKTQPVEVTYPSGAYTNAGEIFARGWDNRWSFQLVGTNTTYTMGGSANGTDIHSAAPFRIVQGNYPGYFDTSYMGPYSAAPIVMSNFLFSAVSADEGLNILFDGGLYDMAKCNVSFFVGEPNGMPNDRIVRIQNATMNVYSFKIAVTKAVGQSGISRVVLDNSTVNSSGRFIFPEGSDGCSNWADKNTFEFIIDNGSSFTFSGMGLGGCTKEGPLTNKLQLVTVDHGSSFVQSGDPADFTASQGHYVFSILNGSTAKFGNRSIYFGNTGYGVTDVIFSNAVHDIKGSYYFGPRKDGGDPSSPYYDTVRANLSVYNGAITNKGNGLRFTSGSLKLVDSLFIGRPVSVQAVDAATARFHANGATMRITAVDNLSSDILYGFDEATVGARGLVVESQYTASPLSQDFADAPGEKGVVTFAGTKDYTLNSTNTTVSTVAVAGVKATFADTARFASALVVTNGAKVVNVPTAGLKGLVLGDAETEGQMPLDFARTIDVAGEIALANPVFTVNGTPVKDVENVLFLADTADAATRTAWTQADLGFVPPADHHLALEVKEVEGRLAFTATVREDVAPAATVVSGEVVVGGKTYGAGEVIEFGVLQKTLTVDSATDAVVSLDPRMTALVLTDGTLTLDTGFAGELRRTSASVSLGATAVLKLTADGLYVGGTLTAEAGATVQGSGMLVGTAAECPATLADGATYLHDRAAFAWPTSGVAYIPIGAAVSLTVEDLAKVAALERIVFLGADSSVTYGLAGAWTFGVPVEGPGTFVFENAGDVTIAGDNARLTGAFVLSNTTCLVTHENGLGSARSGACQYWNGQFVKDVLPYGHTLDFDNGTDVFTNYAAIVVRLIDGNQALRFGSTAPGKALVQAADFSIVRPKTDGTWSTLSPCLFANDVTFLAAFTYDVWQYQQYLYPKTSAGGCVRFLGSFANKNCGNWYVGAGTYCYGSSSISLPGNYFAYANESNICLAANQFAGCTLQASGAYHLLLNGYDQNCFGVSGVGSMPVISSPTPASLRVTGNGNNSFKAKFTGAAGFTMAGSGAYAYVAGENTTTGALAVESGTLSLTNGTAWSGTNVTVRGGTLAVCVDAAKKGEVDAAFSRKTRLAIAAANATLAIAEGRTETVRTLTVGEAFVPAGVYGGPEAQAAGLVDAEHTLDVLSGKGLLRVLRSSDEPLGVLLIVR